MTSSEIQGNYGDEALKSLLLDDLIPVIKDMDFGWENRNIDLDVSRSVPVYNFLVPFGVEGAEEYLTIKFRLQREDGRIVVGGVEAKNIKIP